MLVAPRCTEVTDLVVLAGSVKSSSGLRHTTRHTHTPNIAAAINLNVSQVHYL